MRSSSTSNVKKKSGTQSLSLSRAEHASQQAVSGSYTLVFSCHVSLGGGLGERTVTLGMFPRGCEDTVARRWLLFKGGLAHTAHHLVAATARHVHACQPHRGSPLPCPLVACKQVQPQHPFFGVHVPVCLAVFFVRRPRSACHVERTFSLMGHIQTKDRLHMGNNTLRHLAMMYVNKPTTDDPDGESDSFGPPVLCMSSLACESNLPQKRRYPHVQVEACRSMPQHKKIFRGTALAWLHAPFSAKDHSHDGGPPRAPHRL